MTYGTKYSQSPNGRVQIFWVVDESGDTIATVRSIDAGRTWRINGLFPEPSKVFDNSQCAIEQACRLYEHRRFEWADRLLMATF